MRMTSSSVPKDPFPAAHDLALDGRPEDPDPRPLFGRSGHDSVEALADARLEQQRAGGLAHEALDLVRGVLLLSAVQGQAVMPGFARWRSG